MADLTPNKFQIVEDQLNARCQKCEIYDPVHENCLNLPHACEDLKEEYDRLYYELLYQRQNGVRRYAVVHVAGYTKARSGANRYGCLWFTGVPCMAEGVRSVRI